MQPAWVNRALLVCAAAAACLALPATASAHSRTTTVALDYHLTVDQKPRLLEVSILDGDRAVRLHVPTGHVVVVLGDLNEPMLRFDQGVWVSESSPTAQANRLIGRAGSGWHKLSGGTMYAWHEHRLAPPPYGSGRPGAVARWQIPVLVDNRHATIGGAFVRVSRPSALLWLGGVALVVALGIGALRFRPVSGTVTAGVGAGIAALVAQTAFSLRDSPGGHAAWLSIGISAVVGAVAAWLLAVGRGTRRAYIAGAIGAGVAALTLSWLGVFLHGAVISALPAFPMRLVCAVALAGGLLALAGSLSVRVEAT
ncbi:MAG TPA: hypothetical protein VGH52_11795 [Gaiellaceae bacterium]